MGWRDYDIVVAVARDLRSLLDKAPSGTYGGGYSKLGGGTALHWAVRMEDPAEVAQILALGGVDVNATDEVWKATALHWAARIGNLDVVAAMVAANHSKPGMFDIKIEDKWSFTAVQHAALSGITANLPLLREFVKFKDNATTLNILEEVEEIFRAEPSTNPQTRLDMERERWFFTSLGSRMIPLHWSVMTEDTARAEYILEVDKVDVNYRGKHRDSGSMKIKVVGTALCWAIKLRNVDIVKVMVAKHVKSGNFNVNDVDHETGYTLLHWAIVSGERENIGMVMELLKCKDTMRMAEECKKGQSPLQIAHERGFKDIQKALMEQEPVRRYVEQLYRDRQVYVDAANAILVGAALIASVTFGSWLQPPMGYTNDYANVQDSIGLRAFWVFNSLSFYFAIATVVFGARSVLPRSPYFIKRTVEKLRKNLLATSVLLACSVFFVIIAFGIAGCIVLTPVVKFQLYMIIPTIFGGLVCLISLGFLFHSMWEDTLGKERVAKRKYEWFDHTTLKP